MRQHSTTGFLDNTAIPVAVPRGPKRSLIQWSALGFLAVVLVVLGLVKVQSWGMPGVS